MNSQKGPLQDVLVRRALQLAFDYEGMVDVYQGYADVPSQPLPMGFTEAYDPDLPAFQQDLEQARQLLAEAGYPDGGFSIEFMYTENEPQARLAGLLIQSTLQQLGITVNLTAVPFATLVAQVANLDTAPDMHATLTMTPRTADPGELLATLYASANAGQAYNYGWYANPEVDELLAEADQTFDDTERMGLYRQVVGIIIEDAASIWAAYPRLVEVMRVEVQNYQYNPLNYTGVFPCYPIWLDE
jgi:peptide/nickel transport system substrate-binding protein